ncbi:type II toxin-antitoxin system VapC family toxin [Rhizobium wenxiniae]|uniref:type II toxin-antitoxin system VapC family toxin n=1 Tax=Rhizobium wenxiniae TaxID=1737357 RepID=UPI001C6EE853|nr:type II toxin-antitoxin system VapC family toxin [Rhizobium wenxiniae]MBW9089554.1 type II toxin-antitoxin system VapC family toxin [Rhizobium wenxiniae]
MRYLLDTNILSNITKPEPSTSLMAWMAEQADEALFIASLTVAEIHRGILEKPAGKKRAALEAWFAGNEGPQSLFAGRVLPFDEKAALIWGELMAHGKATGRPRSALDTIVAAIAQSNNCIVITDNERDFQGIDIINPLRATVI